MSRPSDDAQPDNEQLSQLDPTSSTASTSSRAPDLYQPNRDGDPTRCAACREKRRYEISYTIEDLDLEPTEPRSTSYSWNWQADQAKKDQASGGDAGAGSSSQASRPDLRKYKSTDGRWTNSSFLSPDDALWDLKKNTDSRTEFRWELHSSKTDIDLARQAKCGYHAPLTPEEKRHPERGDLRKHHSAEGDKWSLRPDSAHDLRKHLSDNSRIAGEPKSTLQVPEVLPNPKPKCKCPKAKVAVSSDTSDVDEQSKKSDVPEKSPQPSDTSKKVVLIEEPKVLKKQFSMQVPSKPKSPKVAKSKKEKAKDKEKEKEKSLSPEEQAKKTLRSKWAKKSHFSLPQVERKDSTWALSHENPKSKSLKERPKYSVRRSISPDPDPRQVMRLDNRVIRRLISPEISLQDAKWAPYEGYSPLPNVGIRKREPKRISEFKWVPYDGSPEKKEEVPTVVEPSSETDEPKDSATVTPTHHPPPESAECRSDEEEERWRFLNVVSPFPLYQGAWKDESPPQSPPKDQSTPVWIATQDLPKSPIRISEPSPSPQKKRSIIKGRKKALRTKSEMSKTIDEGLAPPRILSRAASEEPKGRQRPQLQRSKALLEVPLMDATKRSLSEEVPRFRSSQKPSRAKPHRAKSEETRKYDPWKDSDSEMMEYVTTV